MQYRKLTCILASLLLVNLHGCGFNEETLNDEVRKAFDAQLQTDVWYQQYLQLKEDNQLDEEGFYLGTARDAVETEGVQVTFAENAAFKPAFSYDPEGKQPVEGAACVLQPGDRIYAAAAELSNQARPGYRFTGYRIWSYDAAGKRTEYPIPNEAGLLLEVPDDADITGFSIEMLGGYAEKTLQLSDFCRQNNGDKLELSGIWKINELETHDISAKISLLSPYTVQYLYDPKMYYVVSCKPEGVMDNAAEGILSFHVSEGFYEENQYTVELDTYVMGSVQDTGDMITEILVEGKKQATEQWQHMRLIPGQLVQFTVKAEAKLTCDESKGLRYEAKGDGYLFELKVPEDTDTLTFRSANWREKEIAIEVPRENLWQQFLSLFKTDKEDTLLQVKCGEELLTYKDLKQGKKLIMQEQEQLQVIIDDAIQDTPNLAFSISINGAAPHLIHKASPETYLSFGYDEVENVNITMEKGYVFSFANIDNGDLKVQYYVEQKLVTEGDFLPVGTEVTVRVTNAEISDTIVKITEKTKSADFVVKKGE